MTAATQLERRQELTVGRRAMACEFDILFPAGNRGGVEAGCAALDEVDRLERKLSVFIDDSDIAQVNRRAAEEPVRVDAEVFDLLRFAATLARATGGAFDAASGALLKAWGFQGGPRRVPAEPERIAALAASGHRHVVFDEERRTVAFLRPGVAFNLGAIGKGYAIDRAVHVLRHRHGTGCAFVHGGQSSLRAIGVPPGEPRGWKVDLADPCGGCRPLARVHLRDRALGTSGAANQFFVAGGRRYGHILDPRTGWPAAGLAGVSVLAPTAAEADALSTAFYVMGAGAARRFCRRRPAIGAVLVHDGTGDGAPRVEVLGVPEVETLI